MNQKQWMNRELEEELMRFGEDYYRTDNTKIAVRIPQYGDAALPVIDVVPLRYDEQGQEIKPVYTGWFPQSQNIACYAIKKMARPGIPVYGVVYGKTANDTMYGKPVSRAFTEAGARQKLQILLEDLVTKIEKRSGIGQVDPQQIVAAVQQVRLDV